MSMSKKDFIALADELKGYNPEFMTHDGKEIFHSMVAMLADFCAAQNPAFKRDRWLAYIASGAAAPGECGKNGGAVKKGKES